MILTWKNARRLVVAVIGGTVVLIGILLGPLPFVPAVVIIPLGLAILATEFVWAQQLLKKVKQQGMRLTSILGSNGRPPDLQATRPATPENVQENGADPPPPPTGNSGP